MEVTRLMQLRSWILPALLATPLLITLDGADACIRFSKPGGSVPPGLREPTDPPPPPTPTEPPPATTPPEPTTGPTTGPAPTTAPPMPVTGTGGPDITGGADQPGPKAAAKDDGTWETWWELNRIEFFPRRFVEAVVSTEGVQEKGPKALDPSVVRAKLWPALMTLKDDKQAFVREAALITMGRVASDEGLKAEAREILLKAIKDPNKMVARSAALGLFYVANEECLLPMHQVANDKNATADVRAFLALTFTAMNSPLAGPLLTKLVDTSKNAEFELVAAAIMALGYVPGPESAKFLKDTFANKKLRPEFRAQAVESFGRRAVFEDGWEILLDGLKDKETEVRRSSAIGLGVLDYRTQAERDIAAILAPYEKKIGVEVTKEHNDQIEALKAQIPAQREKNAGHVREIVKRLTEQLQKDNDQFVCSMSAISLGRIAAQTDSPNAVRMLLADLKKERNVVREFEMLALAIAKAPEAYDILCAAASAKNRGPTTHSAALIGLGILGNVKANELVSRVMEDHDNPYVRGYAAIALGMLGNDKSQDAILSMLKTTKAPEAMAYGALGMALLGKRQGADLLTKKLTATTDGFIQSHMVYALGLMKDRKQLDDLVNVSLKDKNYFVQAATIAAIGYIASPEEYPRRHLMAKGFNYMLNLDTIGTYFYKL
jgi:HEAT repeat protein